MPEVLTSQPVIRAMTSSDIPAGLRLCRASKWNQLEEDWRAFLEFPGSGAILAEGAGTDATIVFGRLCCVEIRVPGMRRRSHWNTALREFSGAHSSPLILGFFATWTPRRSAG